MNCVKCGSKVDDRSKFCKMCGTPVNGNTVEQPEPVAPVRTQAQVRNKGVIPTPLYVIGLIFNIFNLLFGIGTFVIGIFGYAIEVAAGTMDNAMLSFTGTLFSGFAAGAAFIAIILGITNRAKPKNGVSVDKTKTLVAFIILTFIAIVLFIIGAYLVGSVMETSL